MTRLDLTLLGSFAAAVSGEPITQFRTDKMRALLAYLAMNGERPFRRDSLATLLWPDWSDEDARRNLRQTLHRLRQMLDKQAPNLGTDLFTTTRQTVQLNSTAVALDVAQFQQHQLACENHTHANLAQCHHCQTHMQQAVALYQGDLLEGFAVKDAFPFEEWLIMQREQLQQQALALLDKLAQILEQSGDYAQAQQYANQHVQLAPWRESAHRQLMRLFALQEQRSAALAQYEMCRELLAQELGVEPEAETVRLWQQIKDGTLATAVVTKPTTRLHGFPTQLTPFIGRQTDISQIMTKLADENCRLLTLIGPGGVGKTRLSVQVGQEIEASQRYSDGAYFIPLAAISEASLLTTTVAQHLNLQLTDQQPQRQLLAMLQDKNMLLVCDNFEQIASGAPLLGEIVARAPDVQILVTSRQPLNLQAEWRQNVGGLDYSQGAESEAVRFFQRSAQRITPQFQLTDEDVTAVLDLSHMVDGLPLALEIAAAWTRMMDCPTILRETQKSLDFLASPLGDLPERHQSIRAVLTQSWQMLPVQRQAILAQLAHFAGSFTLEAALAIVPNLTMLDIATLLDKSLLHWQQPNGRYQMHELLRQFASSQPQKEIETFRENYGRYYLTLVAEQESHLMSHTPQPAITALQKELDNVRQAWRWAVDAVSSDLLEMALNGLLAFHEFRGTFNEGCQQFATAVAAMPPADLTNRLQLAQARCLEILGEMDQAMALTRRVVQTELRATQLPALIRLARLYERTSQYDEALQTLHTALPLADPFSIEAAKIWNIFGLIYRYRGALDESIAAHGKALTICQAIDDPLELAESQANLSLTYRVMADYETAVLHLEQALAIAKRLNHQEKISGFTHSLGVLYWQQDDLANAQACMAESLAIAEQLNHKRLMAICANGLGVIARRNYEHDKALRYLHRALRLAQEVGDSSLQAIMVGIIGLIYQDIGDYEQAINYLQQAADLDRSMGTLSGVARHLGNIGDAYRLQRQYLAALPYFEEAIDLLRQNAAPYYLCWVLVSYAYCLFEVGRLDEAQVANAEGGRVAAEIGREVYELFSMLLAARLQAQAGNVTGALAQIQEFRSRFASPEFTAEIDYALWQISGDAAHKETAVRGITALYERTQIAAYRIRLANM